jgi:P-type Ca2+ transporter type 2C
MSRPPRPRAERILNPPRLARILVASAVMAIGTLAVLIWAPGPEPELGRPTTAGTMAFVTIVLFQAVNLLNVRSDIRSVFSRETLENRSALSATAVVVILLVTLVQWDAAHGLFHTVDLTGGQWLTCTAVSATSLVTGEMIKAVLRARRRPAPVSA